MYYLFLILFLSFIQHAQAVFNVTEGNFSASLSPSSQELIITDLSTEKFKIVKLPSHQAPRSVGIYNTDCYIGFDTGLVKRVDLLTGMETGNLNLPGYLNDLLIDHKSGKAYASCGTHLITGHRGTSGGKQNQIKVIKLKTFSVYRTIPLKLCPGNIYQRDNWLIILNTLNESVSVMTTKHSKVRDPLYVGNWPVHLCFSQNNAYVATNWGVAILDQRFLTKKKFIQTCGPVLHVAANESVIVAALRTETHIFKQDTYTQRDTLPHSPMTTLDYMPQNVEYTPRQSNTHAPETHDYGKLYIPFDAPQPALSEIEVKAKLRAQIQQGNLWKYIDLSLDLKDVIHLGAYNNNAFMEDLHREDEDLFLNVLTKLTTEPITLTPAQIQAYKTSDNPVGLLAILEEPHHQALKQVFITALSARNPYALALMHLACKYNLWGIPTNLSLAQEYAQGADEETIESYNLQNPI